MLSRQGWILSTFLPNYSISQRQQFPSCHLACIEPVQRNDPKVNHCKSLPVEECIFTTVFFHSHPRHLNWKFATDCRWFVILCNCFACSQSFILKMTLKHHKLTEKKTIIETITHYKRVISVDRPTTPTTAQQNIVASLTLFAEQLNVTRNGGHNPHNPVVFRVSTTN